MAVRYPLLAIIKTKFDYTAWIADCTGIVEGVVVADHFLNKDGTDKPVEGYEIYDRRFRMSLWVSKIQRELDPGIEYAGEYLNLFYEKMRPNEILGYMNIEEALTHSNERIRSAAKLVGDRHE